MVSRNMQTPLSLGRVRFAHVDDTPAIMALMTDSMFKNFRIQCVSDITMLIENSAITICLLDVTGAVVGCLSAKDYPFIPCVHPCAWEEYIWTKYKTTEMNSRNTLFIHLLCWKPVYARDAVDRMLKSMFMHDPYLRYVCMTKTLVNYPLLVPGQLRAENSFKRITSMERGVPGDMLPVLCAAERCDVSPRLKIRRAVEEDNDDIVPIIERHSARLRALYGEFYVSELISRHPESERVLLVCEHKELAVGVMCLNTVINYSELEEAFNLNPFGGLRHSGDSTEFVDHESEHTPTIEDHSALHIDTVEKSSKLKINTNGLGTEEAVSFGEAAYRTSEDDNNSNTYLSFWEEEVFEEELEFEIINIDTRWMKVPKLLSMDSCDGQIAYRVTKLLDSQGNKLTLNDDISTKGSERDVKFKRNRRPSLVSHRSQDTIPPKRYTGEPNAFIIELFAMHPDYDERYGFDILEVSFEMFPGRDYCIICLPSDHTAFPLLEHFTLVTPLPNVTKLSNESLYVTHVNSVRGIISCRPGEAYDLPDVQKLLVRSHRKKACCDLFLSTIHSYTLSSFVLLSQNQPVGVVVLGPAVDPLSLRSQYRLEPDSRRPGTDGTILMCIVSPVFDPHARWFLRDLMRQTKYCTLFWVCRLIAKGDQSPNRNLISVAGLMYPVKPRPILPNITGKKDLDLLVKDVLTPFSLWMIERPLTSLPKADVNNTIVVVGASRTGLSFLETLIMGPTAKYLTFTNLTLVSEYGLPVIPECLMAADICVPRNGRYTDRYLKSVPFYFYVDIITATVIKIDRKTKSIYFKNGTMKHYDELVLTFGLQFQYPDYLRDNMNLEEDCTTVKLNCDRLLMDNPQYRPDRLPEPPSKPDNVWVINSVHQANHFLRKLLRMISECDDKKRLSSRNLIIVYGDCLEAYSCMSALLELGIEGDMIFFVDPFPPDDINELRVNCFNNETVDERVYDSLLEQGIHVVRRTKLIGWAKNENTVTTVQLMSQLHTFELPCFAMFYYGIKAIDLNAFKAVNECGLVYDGGLVVGPNFETHDPHIYAAGPCVRYSRRLYAKIQNHRYFNSEDVGESLARIFVEKLDPFVVGNSNAEETNADVYMRHLSSIVKAKTTDTLISASRTSLLKSHLKWEPVPRFASPLVQYSILPGPLYYVKVRKPGQDIPFEVFLSLPNKGHLLETDYKGNYFRLHVNVLHCIEGLTVLYKKPVSQDLLMQLYEKHEAFFNKMLIRYYKCQIYDFYEYFTQPWMNAIYQESFDELMSRINGEDVSTVYNIVKSQFQMVTESMLFDEDSEESLPDISTIIFSSCFSMHSCRPSEAKTLGTFKSIIEKFVTRTSSMQLVDMRSPTDIPTECGQSAEEHDQANNFWREVGGKRIIVAKLAEYLNKHIATNPHYALPKIEFY